MTNVFEDANIVTSGDKEIKSITINGDVLYDTSDNDE